uniref:Ribosomal protein S8 n=1 Tax=Phaeophyceae sp. TaxID=2249243 RepID=A0A8E5BE99_9PHAE|nr:ribosomal protein S8 [Phaeophyceae sp.]
MKTDIIADMLTRIRNATLVRHQIVRVINTKMTLSIVKLLIREGYIANYEIINIANNVNHSYLLLTLKYYDKKEQVTITGIKRVSKPGLRIYVKKKKLPTVLNNLGTAILSTSQGLVTSIQAKQLGIGGEVICYIW